MLTVALFTVLVVGGFAALASGAVMTMAALWDGDLRVAAIFATGTGVISFALLNLAALVGATITL